MDLSFFLQKKRGKFGCNNDVSSCGERRESLAKPSIWWVASVRRSFLVHHVHKLTQILNFRPSVCTRFLIPLTTTKCVMDCAQFKILSVQLVEKLNKVVSSCRFTTKTPPIMNLVVFHSKRNPQQTKQRHYPLPSSISLRLLFFPVPTIFIGN